jgi:hypothetical protein
MFGAEPVSIKRMDTPAEELAVLEQVLDSNKISPMTKDKLLKKTVGSWCVICGGIPTQIASYDCSGATRIERYCDACVEKTFSRTENLILLC